MAIDSKRFELLCSYADEVFDNFEVNDYLVANPYLHLLRPHPILLKPYEQVFNEAKNTAFTRICRNARICRDSFSNWRSRQWKKYQPYHQITGSSNGKLDILIISHVVNKSHIGTVSDFYYGDLPARLTAKGFRVGLAYINQIGLGPEAFANRWSEDGISRFLLSSTPDPRELKARNKHLRKVAKKLKRYPVSCRSQQLFMQQAADRATSVATHTNLNLTSSLGKILEKFAPRMVVFTHEGHAWERLFCRQISQYDKGCLRAGYIHAALFASQHSLYSQFPVDYNPGRVFTTGETARKQLKDNEHYLADVAVVLGTHKIPQSTQDRTGLARNCLVLPEGLTSESLLLFRFSLLLAKRFPDVTFIWRLHPLISFHDLHARDRSLKHLPENIQQSQSPFEADLKTARWALYRGSTAIFQALAAGIRPLYLPGSDGINIDPLHQLQDWKTAFRAPEDYQDVFHGSSDKEPEDEKAAERATAFSRELYSPFDLSALVNCLPVVQEHGFVESGQ